MKKQVLETIGLGICVVVSFLGLVWELAIVKALWGFWAAALALVLFPGTLTLVPWYLLFAYGNCQLVIFIYGGWFLGGLLVFCFHDDEPYEEEVPARQPIVQTEAVSKYSEAHPRQTTSEPQPEKQIEAVH